MSDATERLSASIVLAGKFNPAIFHPAWIARTGLVSEADVADAQLSVTHPEIAIFMVGGYSFEVQQERFAVHVQSEPLVRALDAALVIFDDMLPHTPVTQIGINYTEHFKLDNAERRVRFGRALTPLAPWGTWGKKIASLAGERTSGVISLTMQETYDQESGYRRVDVQPSAVVEPINLGVFVSVNDHRNVSSANNASGTGPAISLLKELFDRSISESRAIVNDLTTFALSA